MKRVFVFISILFSFFITGCDQSPAKIIDPYSPDFKAADFQWDGYKSSKDFEEALRKLFPIGTDRDFVEKILTANPRTIVGSPVSVAEQKKKTGGFLMGHVNDKILYSDPRFKNATTIVTYHNPKKTFFQLTSSSRIIRVFYDDEGHLLNLAFYTDVIHKHQPQKD